MNITHLNMPNNNPIMNHARIAIFDLDHTLLPIDSDYEWGQFLCQIGAVDRASFEASNKNFYDQYQAGTLDAGQYLEFALSTLAQFSPTELTSMHERFMHDIIRPAIRPAAQRLLELHSNDLLLMIWDADQDAYTKMQRERISDLKSEAERKTKATEATPK